MLISSGVKEKAKQEAILCYFRVLRTMFYSDQGWYDPPDYNAYRKCFGWTMPNVPANLSNISETQPPQTEPDNFMYVPEESGPNPVYDAPETHVTSNIMSELETKAAGSGNVMYVTEETMINKAAEKNTKQPGNIQGVRRAETFPTPKTDKGTDKVMWLLFYFEFRDSFTIIYNF